MTALTALHVACGAGGTSLGFERAGIRTAYAVARAILAADRETRS